MQIEESHILELIKELEFLIQEASSVPFSTHKCSIERQDALDIISDIKRALPKELEQAVSVTEESKDIMNRAISEAHQMIEDAENKANEIIEDAKIEAEELRQDTEDAVNEYINSSKPVLEAEEKAHKIISNAKAVSEEIKVGTAEYADELLLEVEQHIVSILDEIRQNREEFK
ncbi:hypothetical protein [Peptacetobacter sp.]|uniref:hypothetical protein n=1 Tax=Peptacetobacter sp. TaxID=2991975 RepID=UPI002603AAC1|nr:hypothetical protein [Peptacetobacter sp.]